VYFTFFIRRKTGNQLKIHLVPLLAYENEYSDDLFAVVLSQKKILTLTKRLYRYNLLKIIK